MEKFNEQVKAILLALQTKLTENFGAQKVDPKTSLQLAKELGYLQGKRGREGGTFATETGMTFAQLRGEIIKPVTKADKKAALALAQETSCPMVSCPVPAPEVTVTEVP